MRKNILIGAVITIFSFGCATQENYNLHGFYKSKNSSLNLVSKLSIHKSGSYTICTSTLDHEKEHPDEGNYYCIEGIWTQQKNKVTLVANTWDGKPGVSFTGNQSIAILDHSENLANPTTLSILQPSGSTMTDISVSEAKAGKENSWENYKRSKGLN